MSRIVLAQPFIEIVSLLKTYDLVRTGYVFGSMAACSMSPKDIDGLWIVPNDKEMDRLCMIANRYYGYFDPFVYDGSKLLVRNDEATGYRVSRLSFEEIIKKCIPFKDLFLCYELGEKY